MGRIGFMGFGVQGPGFDIEGWWLVGFGVQRLLTIDAAVAVEILVVLMAALIFRASV